MPWKKSFDERACAVSLPSPADMLPSVLEQTEPSRFLIIVELIKFDMALHADAGTLRWIDANIVELAELLTATKVSCEHVLEEIQLLNLPRRALT